jgi:hypothetical protein
MTPRISPGTQIKWRGMSGGRMPKDYRGHVIRCTGVRALVHRYPHGTRSWVAIDRLEVDTDVAQVEPPSPPPPPGPAVPKAPSLESARMRDMAMRGMTVVEIAKAMRAGHDTVRKRLAAMGLKAAVRVNDGRVKVPEKYKWMEKYEKRQSW